MENAFGHGVCEIRELFEDKEVEEVVLWLFENVLDHLGVPGNKNKALGLEAAEYLSNGPMPLEALRIGKELK